MALLSPAYECAALQGGFMPSHVKPKPVKVEPWMIAGSLAALRDPNDKVKGLALGELGRLAKVETAEAVAEFLDPKYTKPLRIAALEAYAALGVNGRKHLPQVAWFLADPYTASAAIKAISVAGAAQEYRLQILKLLNSGDSDIRIAAMQALASAGLAGEYRPQILQMFDASKDPEKEFRPAAAQVVETAGLVKEYRQRLASLLDSGDSGIRIAAMRALASAGLAGEYRPQMLQLFNEGKGDPFGTLRVGAAQAVMTAGLAEQYQPQILQLFDEDNSSRVRIQAIKVVATAGLAEQYRSQILRLFDAGKDPGGRRRLEAVEAVASAGLAREYKKQLSEVLEAKDVAEHGRLLMVVAATGLPDFRQVIAAALVASHQADVELDAPVGVLHGIGEAGTAKEYLPQIIARLNDEDDSTKAGALFALKQVADLRIEELAVLLGPAYDNSSFLQSSRFLVHYCGGGREEPELLLKLLAPVQREPIKALPREKDRRLAFRLLLRLFGIPKLRKELQADIATLLAALAESMQWRADDAEDKKILATAHENLAMDYHPQAALLQNVISKIERTQKLRTWWTTSYKTILLHLGFWMALIFLYPRSGMVQAIFFWNPWVRKVTGLGYVGFALTWVPLLRRRLLAPFRESLLADARLHGFSDTTYYAGSKVKDRVTGERGLITEMLKPDGGGQIVLVGESGLGKSMFLRYLAFTSKRIVAYLPAEACALGVLEAVQTKLIGQANDGKYLRNLIWSGALDIYIDGLNEVTADTRAKISEFSKKFFRGNVIMTTQPIEWKPPSTTRIYALEPLERSQIQEFLVRREAFLPEDAILHGADYRDRCESFLKEVLSSELLEGTLRILSNPMDLTVVADMIGRGQKPNLFRLQEQHYEIMVSDFSAIHAGRPFPLAEFSEAVYEMRLTDRRELTAEPFGDLLECLERFKMVLRREDEAGRIWLFRHDKIMDFFLVQAFLGSDNRRPDEHLADPRFRGVYLMLATLLPYEEALALREKLLQHAADTKDHSISDTFIQLLRPRETKKAA